MNASSSSDSPFFRKPNADVPPLPVKRRFPSFLFAIAALTTTLHAVKPVQEIHIIGAADNELHLSDAQREAKRPGTAQRMAAKRAALAIQLAHENQQCSERIAAFKAQTDPKTLAKWRADDLQLRDVVDGRPVFEGETNADAAVSSGTDKVRRQAAFLNVDGAGFSVGVWEARLGTNQNHDEWRDRYSFLEPQPTAGSGDHGTHVIGTIAAAGIDPDAIGMAPSATIRGYHSGNDSAEMLAEAAGSEGEFFNDGRILVSNHSYSILSGWGGSTWYGPWPPAEDPKFGLYDTLAATYDQVCDAAPYYLPFKSASNERNEGAPAVGVFFSYTDSMGTRRTSLYGDGFGFDPPASDAAFDGGYDTLPLRGVAKNVMTVGAVGSAVSSAPPLRDLSVSVLASYSSWGPSDDGRIKPDIVADGEDLYSTTNTFDFSVGSTYGPKSGTSMATPTACGSAVLLQDYFSKRSPGDLMRAATLKGLIIHTTDDFGVAGPDYQSGWGWLNTLRAAEQIKRHLDDPSRGHMLELLLPEGIESVVPIEWDQESPEIRVTLCYTDPAGTAQSGLDNPARNLVNDLDIVLHGPGGSIAMPFVLDPANPNALATTGDNDLDNVEQILITEPAPGGYELHISHEGDVDGGLQAYSLIISGGGIPPIAPAPVPVAVRILSPLEENFSSLPLAVDGWSYESTGSGDGRIEISKSALRMDDTSNSSKQAINAATLHLDLTNQNDVILRFNWTDTNDSAQPMPLTTFGTDLAEADGVAFSADGGNTWSRIMSLDTETSDDVRHESVNLTALMDSRGFTDHSDVRVRFQQFGNRISPNDGVSFDNVRIYIGNPGTFSFSVRQLTSVANTSVDVPESIGEVLIEIQRTGGFDGTATVNIGTMDGSASRLSDYSERNSVQFFNDGDDFKTFPVPITDDGDSEVLETFILSLSSPTNGAMLADERTTITVRIIDNENAPVSGVAPIALSPVALVGDDAAPQTLLVSNTGGGSLNYTVKTSRPWISVASGASGSVLEDETARVKLEFATAGLLPGRYSGEVILDDTTGQNAAIKVPVSLLIGFEGETAAAVNTVIPVQIPGSPDGRAAVWPLSFSIPPSTGRIVDASLLMTGFEHEEVGDLDIVLSSPSGTAVGLMSDVSNGEAFGSALPFADNRLIIQRRANPLPFKTALTNPGIYRPADYEQGIGELPDIDGAPQTWSTELGDFNGVSPNGEWQLWINDDDPGSNGGELGKTRLALRTAIIEDVIAERFDPGNLFDLNQHSLMFTPAPELPEGYTVDRYALDDFPIPPDGTVLTPPKNDASLVSLTGPPVLFHGQEFSNILVFEDGVIGFSPDEGARISVFDNDLATGTGTITIEELADRVAVSWVNIVDDASSEKISFGVELFHDGRIRMNYPVIDVALPGTVGLVRRHAVAWSTNFGNLSDLAPIQPVELLSFGIPEGKGDIVITSSSQPDVLYALEVSEDLNVWKQLEAIAGTGNALPFEIERNSKADRSFYRIRRTSTPIR